MSLEGAEFNDFMDRLWATNDLKREKGMEESIVELKSLIHGHRVGSNSAGNSKVAGALVDRITKNVDLRQSGKIGNGFGNWEDIDTFKRFRQTSGKQKRSERKSI